MATRSTPDQRKAENEEKEKKKEQRIESLRSRLAHLTSKPYYAGHLDLSPDNLARWLEVSDHCVMLAAARLRASIEHARIVSKMTSAPTFTPTAVIKKHLGGGMCGVDRQGSLVYFLLFGLTDMLGMIKSCSRDQFVVYWVSHIQAMIDQLKSQSGSQMNVHNVLLIVDLKGCSNNALCWTGLQGWAQVYTIGDNLAMKAGTASPVKNNQFEFGLTGYSFTCKFPNLAAQIYEDTNPGLFKEIILINPSYSLRVLHNVITSSLKPSTRRKVVVIGAANTFRHLLLRIEKHEIPAYLGGYKCDMDNNPYCRNNINWPHKVPRWCHHRNPCLPADVIDVVVPAGSVFKIDVPVFMSGGRITWDLFQLSHPITLKLMPPAPPPSPDRCRDPLEKPRPLYTARLDTHKVRQGNIVSCPVAGLYSLVLDNSKNMSLSVRAKAKVNVLTPEGYLGRFKEQIPLGDDINFFEPVTSKERQQRKEMYQASKELCL